MADGGGEEKLIRDCLADDPKAWDELVRRYSPMARASATAALVRCGMKSVSHLAEEAVQKTFCEIWEKKKLADLRDAALIRPYIGSIAACRAIDSARSVFRSKERRADWEEPGSNGTPAAMSVADERPGPREHALRTEAGEIVAREIGGLPEKEAFILRMSLDEDLTHQSIADLVGIPRDTVSTVIRRSREKIKKSLELRGFTEKGERTC